LLDLDEATVRRQMTGIMRALNVSSRIKAALIAQRLLEHQSF
jgi:DNA-binding NarL/FixJ family response regulator